MPPELINHLLDCLRGSLQRPDEAWSEIVDACRSVSANAPWDELPRPDLASDVEAATAWLDDTLPSLWPATGIYLGLDTLNMEDRPPFRRFVDPPSHQFMRQYPNPAEDQLVALMDMVEEERRILAAAGLYGHLPYESEICEYAPPKNVEIGASDTCVPEAGGTAWAFKGLCYAEDDHLILGLRDLRRAYSRPAWHSAKGPGERSASAFADFALFLSYSGIVLSQAVSKLKVDSPTLYVWGFHDGDLFELGHHKRGGSFELLCR